MARRFTPPPTDDLTNFSITDPTSSTAVTTAIVDQYGSVLITTTAAGNAQTIASPTNTIETKRLTVMNNDTSSDSIVVNGVTLTVGTCEDYVWDGSAWLVIGIGGGSGDVSKVGTPVDNQVGVWTGDGTIEGTTGLTYDGSNLHVTGDIGITGTRITKGWFTDLEVTNAIAGSITGNAATVTNATLTTALTVNTGTLTLTAAGTNDSVLTIGAGAVSVSGANTGDNTVCTSGTATTAVTLATARTIGGVSFDGSANITVASATGGFTVSGGSLTLGVASTEAGVSVYQNATNANTVTIQSGVTSGTYTLTLPLAVAGAGEVLTDAAGNGVLSWAAAGGGLTWGDSIDRGVSASDGITFTNTDGTNVSAIFIDASAGNRLIEMDLDNTSAGAMDGLYINLAANSAASNHNAIQLDINANAGAGSQPNGIKIFNRTATSDITNQHGIGLLIRQLTGGATNMALHVKGDSNMVAATNGLVNFTLNNTQSGASVMQKIDLGTSAQANVGLSILAYGASSNQKGIEVNLGSAGTGKGMRVTVTEGGANNPTALDLRTDGGARLITFLSTINSNTVSQIMSGQNNFSGTLGSRTSSQVNITCQRNHTGATTISDDFDSSYIRRISISGNAGATFNATGSVQHLENVATQTSGTLTDTVAVLKLTQDNDSTGGHILMNSYTGTPLVDGTFYFDGSDLKARIGGTTYTFTKT